MEVSMTVTLKTNGGLEIGTFTEEDNDIPAHHVPGEIMNMAESLSQGKDLAGVLRNPPAEDSTPEGYGAKTVGELMNTPKRPPNPTITFEGKWEPAAPSVPRRTPLERAVESGETRVPDELRGTPAGNEMLAEGLSKREARRLYYIDRLIAGVRDVARAWQGLEARKPIEIETAVSRAVAAAYSLAFDRYLPRHLASLLDYVTPEESAADILADLFVMFAQCNTEMERRGLKGYRSMRIFEAAAQWMRDNRPEMIKETGYLPEAARPAWVARQPTGRLHWKAGDTVRLNDTSAAIFNTPPIRRRVLMQIARERYRHTDEMGWTPAHDDIHAPHDWLAILVRELGAGAFAKPPDGFRSALIKVAAVATAAVEALDRKDPVVVEVLAEIERRQAEGNE